MALLEYALVKGINVIIERRAKTTVMRLKETVTPSFVSLILKVQLKKWELFCKQNYVTSDEGYQPEISSSLISENHNVALISLAKW